MAPMRFAFVAFTFSAIAANACGQVAVRSLPFSRM